MAMKVAKILEIYKAEDIAQLVDVSVDRVKEWKAGEEIADLDTLELLVQLLTVHEELSAGYNDAGAVWGICEVTQPSLGYRTILSTISDGEYGKARKMVQRIVDRINKLKGE